MIYPVRHWSFSRYQIWQIKIGPFYVFFCRYKSDLERDGMKRDSFDSFLLIHIGNILNLPIT